MFYEGLHESSCSPAKVRKWRLTAGKCYLLVECLYLLVFSHLLLPINLSQFSFISKSTDFFLSSLPLWFLFHLVRWLQACWGIYLGEQMWTVRRLFVRLEVWKHWWSVLWKLKRCIFKGIFCSVFVHQIKFYLLTD